LLDGCASSYTVRALGSVFGFGTYANTISFVLTGDVLEESIKLVSRYAHLFSTVNSAGEMP
jgi:hypothetical protein